MRYSVLIRRHLIKLVNLIVLLFCQHKVPTAVNDNEVILRAVIYPTHFKKPKLNQLAPYLFRPPGGSDEISVMRHNYMSAKLCKRRAKIFHWPPEKKYTGFAVFRASVVSAAYAKIIDSRCEYLGHADIKYGIVALPKDEPLNALTNKVLEEKIQYILDNSKYIPDSDPNCKEWLGPGLVP